MTIPRNINKNYHKALREIIIAFEDEGADKVLICVSRRPPYRIEWEAAELCDLEDDPHTYKDWIYLPVIDYPPTYRELLELIEEARSDDIDKQIFVDWYAD